MKKIKRIVLVSSLFLVTVLFTLTLTKLNGLGFSSEIDRVAIITDYVIRENQPKYYNLVTTIFDKAKGCEDEKCRKDISLIIHNDLVDMKAAPFYEGLYFIRVGEGGSLEKMFLHGEVKVERVDTNGEKKVYRFLQSNTQDLFLKGFRIDLVVSNMRYLGDFYSEAEIIVPIRTYDGARVVGAVVKGYGD